MSEQVDQFYPNPVINHDTDYSPHTNGSFGPVFIVLAVIVVISSVACMLGRVCKWRRHLAKEAHHQTKAYNKQSHVLGPKEWESRQKPSFNMRDGDIEFGFGHKKIPSVKMAPKGAAAAKGKLFNNGGGHKPDVRFSGNV